MSGAAPEENEQKLVQARSAGARLQVVLVHPEIAWNTGNVGRTCVALGARLHLVEPLGFELSDKRVKRAGLDYWPHLELETWPDWQSFETNQLGLDGSADRQELAQRRTEPLAPCASPSWRARSWFFSAEAERDLWQAELELELDTGPETGVDESAASLYLVFGCETAGLPADLRERFSDRLVCLPMLHTSVRSLNLSTAVAVGLYEVLRRLRVASDP